MRVPALQRFWTAYDAYVDRCVPWYPRFRQVVHAAQEFERYADRIFVHFLTHYAPGDETLDVIDSCWDGIVHVLADYLSHHQALAAAYGLHVRQHNVGLLYVLDSRVSVGTQCVSEDCESTFSIQGFSESSV